MLRTGPGSRRLPPRRPRPSPAAASGVDGVAPVTDAVLVDDIGEVHQRAGLPVGGGRMPLERAGCHG